MGAVLDQRREARTEPIATRLGEGYRPHLDGLRTVAVYLVVLFHAGIEQFSGGFIGVDVFFVLSGYLVTQVLTRDVGRTGRLRRFYARRFRRLLPAAFVALIVSAIVYSAVASQAELASSLGAFKSAFLYVANWYFIHQSTDYFAANVNASPVQQFWSLAVEEQFYFVWPMLLGGLFFLTRGLGAHARRAMQGIVVAAGVVSMLWALHLAQSDISRAYYGTDARAYQLLAGALLALSPGLLRKASRASFSWLAAPVALVGLVLISTSLFSMTPVTRGVWAALASVVLLIGLESVPAGPVSRLLSTGPAVYLGRISYGTYLWHWPVILVAVTVTDHRISPLSTFALGALLATGLASLSFQLLENPIRQQRFLERVSPAVIATGLTVSIVSALVLIPAIIDPYSRSANAAPTTTEVDAGFTKIPDLDFASARKDAGDLHDVVLNENCYGRPVTDCISVRGRRPRILVIGDSHAQMMGPAFAKMAQEHHITFAAAASAGCPWQRNLYPKPTGLAADQVYLRECIAFKKDLYDRVIPALHPDLVVGWSNDYLTRRPGEVYDDGGEALPSSGPAETRRQEKAETERSVRELESGGAKVLLVEPVPTTPDGSDPFVCLTKSKVLEQCRFVAAPGPTPLEQDYRSIADNRRVYVGDFDRLICPFLPICDPVIHGTIVHFDNQHITPKFSTGLARPLGAFLRKDGLIP